MYDGVSLSDQTVLQRAVGDLRVSFKRRGATTALDGLRQAGCLKALFPRPVTAGWADVTFLNTSGGVASGDRLETLFSVGAGARATMTAQAAERFYRAPQGGLPSFVRTQITVAAGASAEWLPQETILFNRCALDRRLQIDLAPDAWFLGVEALVFGRAAMGERVEQAWLRDAIRVRRDGHWLLHDAVRMDGTVDAMLRRKAVGDSARAMATLLHVAPSAEALLTPVRDALAESAVEAGVSAWNGMLVARMLAADSALLRGAVAAALSVIRAPRPLPRVWLC
jgi:urease accessory protein